MVKKSRNFYLSEESLQVLVALAERLNISQAAVMEMALREFAIRQAKSDKEVILRFFEAFDPEFQERLMELGQRTLKKKAKE